MATTAARATLLATNNRLNNAGALIDGADTSEVHVRHSAGSDGLKGPDVEEPLDGPS